MVVLGFTALFVVIMAQPIVNVLVKFQCSFRKRYRYVVGQVERAPRTGRRHLQWFVQFDAKQRPSALARILQQALGTGRLSEWQAFIRYSHCQRRKKDPADCRKYCLKEETAEPGTQFEWGELVPEREGQVCFVMFCSVVFQFNSCSICQSWISFVGVVASAHPSIEFIVIVLGFLSNIETELL